ncbi:sulfotransferase family protein [Teichococcus oryzae]|uniref:Sulfotransferase n=1 Tax=Teichococcus oryzae TaxID=1608942 RepID=A0A5B2TF95_9PROT|nr:sulfotransferase [Pseudoroseomonas oryzae]KAA2212839.1 sulfotransferase [Pseudoroseomonas oryzae]
MDGMLAALGQRAVTHLGLPDRFLQPDALLHRAKAAEALAAFDGEAPFRMLLEQYRQEADLNFIGCFAARYDALRLLRNLAALKRRETSQPAVLRTPISKPIFITGLPRSGTTFLHKMLAEDPENRCPAAWETVFPLPRKPDDPPSQRIAAMGRLLAAFERMAPGFRAVHPIDAESPQECSEITAHVFRSYRFQITHHIPRYLAWLRAADHAPAYRFHRVFLQHLQHTDGRPRRFVLKCPDHVFTLGALAEAYPDARIIFLHRDPLEVLASVAGLTAILRRPFTTGANRQAIGQQVAESWLAGAEAILCADAGRLFPEDRVAHLRFRELTAAPMATIASIYERFNLPLLPDVRQRMERRIARLPHGGYGGVKHALADYGIDADAMRPRFAAYAARFNV